MIVTYGLISAQRGNRLPSATNSHGTPCTCPQASVTESPASAPIRHPPMRWALEIETLPSLNGTLVINSSTRPASAAVMKKLFPAGA